MRPSGALPGSLSALGCLVGLALVVACAGARTTAEWGASLSDRERETALAALPPEARESLMPLSQIFYERITHRRFNSRATFEDPAMRQFFPTVAAYSDYYAALADALDLAHIRYDRPTRIELLGIEPASAGSLRLSLRFVGRNDLPLRWWNAVLERTDEWRWQGGRWWVVPGKV
ncbi:MAG TPA: hypothetical protein ENI85_01060 [Deltaproteobacteria bacterium]|nr:hypothetical protein [Deltaproteobacteria bacterium]